jgi:UDP-N-acetyl-2-amino-2-deoxyglucuronate dehydrogenase
MTISFALIGAAGFIAPRHMRAIKETNNKLVVAFDPYDGVGVIDSFFPEADFFTEFERFDRHVDKLKRRGHRIDFTSICSPNYLHDAHVRFALRSGSDAICEKPLVLNPRNIEPLEQMETETGRKIFTILQLRLHPAIVKLKEHVASLPDTRRVDVDLTYITSRGRWYDISWKGDIAKSGGVATNIGIHFFDMLTYVFGSVQQNTVHVLEPRRAAGYLELQRARVRWFLSINSKDLPEQAARESKTTYRSLTMNGEEVEFSDGFTDLHTTSYRDILAGGGFGLKDAYPSIDLAASIRNAHPIGLKGDYHDFLRGDRKP